MTKIIIMQISLQRTHFLCPLIVHMREWWCLGVWTCCAHLALYLWWKTWLFELLCLESIVLWVKLLVCKYDYKGHTLSLATQTFLRPHAGVWWCLDFCVWCLVHKLSGHEMLPTSVWILWNMAKPHNFKIHSSIIEVCIKVCCLPLSVRSCRKPLYIDIQSKPHKMHQL